MRLPKFETHSFDGCFSLDLPSGIHSELEDDGTMLVFPLLTSPRTEIIAGVFSTPGGHPLTQLMLKSEIERFMRTCVQAQHASIETPDDFDKQGYSAYQAVAQTDNDRWWIARTYGRLGGKKILLIHWNGPQKYLRVPVLAALVSVDPIIGDDQSG